ncbi:MAG: type B 50S ribosomal protein L31 [Chlamydiia bacterium]|nr:type B 50S ribosomal protein L31 [Chlamydiia bacterium]
MKKDIHPPYQQVLFVDSSNGVKFLCGSSVKSNQTEVYEGKEYPVVYVSVSSASHPFFTGSNKFIDTEGRVDKFLKRYAVNEKPKKLPEDKEKSQKSKSKKAKK